MSVFPGIVALVASAWAANVELSLDARSIELGQVIGLSVTVADGSPSGVPKVDSEGDVRIAYQQQVSNSYWVNGKSSRTVKYRFAVAPAREGTFRIGPARVEVNGQVLTTDVQTLRVTPRSEAEKARLEAESGYSVERAWEGQVVLYRYGLRSRVPVAGSRWNISPPDGLVRPRDGDQPRRQFQMADPQGTITVDETWIPWIATAPGVHEYPGAVVQVDLPVERAASRRSPFSDLFGMYETRSEVVATAPSRLEILPLPPAPNEFSGLVGEFEFEAGVDRTRTTVGASVEWTVSLRGDGTLEGLKVPVLAESDAARVYPGTATTDARVVDGRYVGEGRFPWVIVPTREGVLQLPPIRIVTFSPGRGEYVTTELAVPPLDVQPGGEGESKLSSFARPPEAVDAAPVDGVRPVHASGPDRVGIPAGAWVALPWLVSVPGIWVGGRRFAARLREAWRRRREARHVVATKHPLDGLSTDPAERLAQLEAALRGAPSEARTPELAGQREALLAEVARARFGGQPLSDAFEGRVRALLGSPPQRGSR